MDACRDKNTLIWRSNNPFTKFLISPHGFDLTHLCSLWFSASLFWNCRLFSSFYVRHCVQCDRVAIEPGVPCRLCSFCKEGSLQPVSRDGLLCHAPRSIGNLRRYYCHAADFCYKYVRMLFGSTWGHSHARPHSSGCYITFIFSSCPLGRWIVNLLKNICPKKTFSVYYLFRKIKIACFVM